MNVITEYALANIDINNYNKELCSVEKSKDGKYVVKIKKYGKEFYVGSKYSVNRDIEFFLSQVGEFNINTIFVIFGLGTGEHILMLLEQISDSNKILIVEPDTNIIAAFNSLGYSKKILNDKRIVIASLEIEKLNTVIYSVIEEFNINNVTVTTYANYDKIYIDEYIQFYKIIKEFIQTSAININTNLFFTEQFFNCFVKNMKNIVKSTIINELKNKFQGIPAVVVSAGPSLEKNINLLKDVEGRFIIISGGRTVKPLEMVGITPDFVAIVDAGEGSYKVIENALGCTAPLLFCEVTNHDVVEKYKGEKIFFQEGCDLTKVTPEILGEKVDAIFQGGSVAHTCTSFAKYCGCNPIIFVGQDFAYTNNKFHADIASIQNNNEYVGNDIFVDDIYGNPVRTSTLFNSYRRQMEKFIKTSQDVTFINSTEGGANIEGTLVMDLKETIKKYEKVKAFDRKKINSLSSYSRLDKNHVKNQIEKLLVDMKLIKKDCSDAIKYSDEVLKYYSNEKDNDITTLLNNIKKINDEIQKINFIDSLLKPTIFRILMHPEYMEKINDTEKEKGIRLAKQTQILYENIIKAIEKSIPSIEECIVELER